MRSSQRGSVLVFAAGILLVLTGFAVLAFDVGRIFIVRNEMQNAADAAALAGANCLTRQSDPLSAADCVSALASGLNWDRAKAKAADQLGRNLAAGLPLSSSEGHTIEVGYWNVQTQSASGGAFSTGFSPLTAYDKPAVRVGITKDAGLNGGPIQMLTRSIYGGGSDVPMVAQSVAVISSPGSVLPGSLIPQAISKCMYDKFWNSTTGQPVIYTGTPADPWGLSVIGQPWEIRIGSSYHYDTCDSGQWTTFNRDANSAAEVRDLVMNGNPDPLEIGDPTWIKPGTSAANYNDLSNRFPTLPVDVTVVVITDPAGASAPDLSHLDPNGRELPIYAFAGFRITAIRGGSQKYIQGHFIPSLVTPGGSGIGPFYGTYTPPRLAK